MCVYVLFPSSTSPTYIALQPLGVFDLSSTLIFMFWPDSVPVTLYAARHVYPSSPVLITPLLIDTMKQRFQSRSVWSD